MEDNEILEYLKDNKENNQQLNISATLTAIIAILIDKQLITAEDFSKLKEFCLDKIRKQQVENMTDEEKESLKIMRDFEKLFRFGIGEDFLKKRK